MSDGLTEVHMDCLYRRPWQDGFGARGWKLAVSLTDPEVIAATAATGARIPTSVFVHDVLDHALCGLGPSGHRNEAIALLQLAERTGADPTPDFAQMVDEDLLRGQAIGAPLRDVLPPELARQIPVDMGDDNAIIARLEARLGREALREHLIARFFALGAAGAEAARRHYAEQGLDPRRRGPLGLALQALLAQADAVVLERGWLKAVAQVSMTDRRCRFTIRAPEPWVSETAY